MYIEVPEESVSCPHERVSFWFLVPVSANHIMPSPWSPYVHTLACIEIEKDRDIELYNFQSGLRDNNTTHSHLYYTLPTTPPTNRTNVDEDSDL